jgi:hypothetical protein
MLRYTTLAVSSVYPSFTFFLYIFPPLVVCCCSSMQISVIVSFSLKFVLGVCQVYRNGRFYEQRSDQRVGKNLVFEEFGGMVERSMSGYRNW